MRPKKIYFHGVTVLDSVAQLNMVNASFPIPQEIKTLHCSLSSLVYVNVL